MTPKEFFDLVARMRVRQVEYFKTRTGSALQASRELERQVDNEISRVNKILKEKQSPRLF